jgi:hypothetical protein
MVFTVRVHQGYSRRWVLRALGGTAVVGAMAGCDTVRSITGGRPPAPAGPDALAPFHAATVRLAERYDAVTATDDTLAQRLKFLRDNHRAHAEALARVLILPSGTPSEVASASASPDTLEGLLAAEKAAAKEALDASLTAPPWIAGLIGSIAACRATHVEVLS